MSSSSEHEPTASQDYRPATTNENSFVCTYPQLANMNVPNIRGPILRTRNQSPIENNQEPDSTNPPEGVLLSIHNKLDKETEYHIAEKSTDLPIETLTGIVRIEEGTLDNVGRLTYPIVQDADDPSDTNYMQCSGPTIIEAPLTSTVVQNIAKLPQNFTINVDATVGNITSLQSVSQDVSSASQTLWLPTILATGTPGAVENKILDEDRQSGVSQIIIASESFDGSQSTPRHANIVADASFLTRTKNSKVQIISNISIPKNSYTQQYVSPTGKEVTASPVYGTQSHIYKLSTNVPSQKHVNTSILCTKPLKNQSANGGCSTLSTTVINNSPVKNTSYGHSKGTNLNKTSNKVNNGANVNASIVAASSGNTQCHIVSRVVSGPTNKVAIQSSKKSVNTFKSSKNASGSSNSQKSQSRGIKIIQQTGVAHKNENKNWSASVATYKNQSSYSIVDTSNSKVIQKVGSPTHRNQHTTIHKMPTKPERLVLQSPSGHVVLSTTQMTTGLTKAPHYVQSGPTPNLRYVQTYGTPEPSHLHNAQISANQQLTAQILQSLSQPKNVLPATPKIVNHISSPMPILEDNLEPRPVNKKRIIFGDSSTPYTADDILGVEVRPNLSEELMRYSFQPLALVMLDHTYALAAQKQPTVSTPSTPTMTVPNIMSPTLAVAPASPIKGTSPIIANAISYEVQQMNVPTSIIGTPIPVTSVPMSAMTYKPQPQTPQDDDAGSVISSLEGDRRQDDKGGSDTETAPEGEEEGKTRCICDFMHDDGYMICCDRCGEWQHVDCMGIDRQNIPDVYMCELCQPRPVDRRHARAIQMRKREELSALGASDTDSSEGNHLPGYRRKRLLTVTTYTNTSGSCVTTYNSNVPTLPPLPVPTTTLPKRVQKRPKKTELMRKVTKRKLTEKRIKRKKDMMFNKSKYGSNMSNQSHWQESYELAMTNHYSPELRAKIMKYSSKLGNMPNMASAITAHLCTTVPHAGGKILIATRDLDENTPVIELRGKYMLSNQHRPQLQNSARAGSQKPGPYVFFYRLPKDNTQICIDTRTYGNEARFVRRSCKPNAELQHCIIKGTLHVYLVSIGTIQSNTEITVGHDSNGAKQICACGNPKHCKINGFTSLATRKNCDYLPREKRMRNRCSSSSSPASPPPLPVMTTPIQEIAPILTPIKIEKKSPLKEEYKLMSPVKNAIMSLKFEDDVVKTEKLVEEKPEIDLMAKEEFQPDIDEPDFSPPVKTETKVFEEPPEPLKIEPRDMKIEDITPVKEETENENLKEEVKDFKEEEEESVPSEEEKTRDAASPPKEEIVATERVTRNSVLARSACHDRTSRSSKSICTNPDSIDDKNDDSQDKISDVKSSRSNDKKMTREERKMQAILKAFEKMEKAEQRKQEVKERQKRRESDPAQPTGDREDDDDSQCNKKRKNEHCADRRKGRARTTSQSAGALSADEAPPPVCDAAHDVGVSPTCLLVEAVVGSVESTFKLPKTKKTMVNEWVSRSPDRSPSPYNSPYRPPLVSAPSLESLVRVASTIIGDLSANQEPEGVLSPPRNKLPKKVKRVTRSTPPTEVVEVSPLQNTLPQHSAKKRWLRQAISEESDSPTAESPPNEMVTPLKKRRLARESLSCEQPTFTCNDETSPTVTPEESPVKEDNRMPLMRQCKTRNILDSIYCERSRRQSESGHGSDDQSHLDASNDVLNVNIKVPHDTENIRRIIGIPNTENIEEMPTITKPEDIKTINNNTVECVEESIYNKVVPMDIDTTVIPQTKIIETSEHLKDGPSDKSQTRSTDTSGGSSPRCNEMDDIQKKIHSFHTENILFLKSRNKKPPKEKRKKVNLNFDLNMVDDQISIQLRTENEEDDSKSPDMNGDDHEATASLQSGDGKTRFVSMENIPLPPVPAPETIPLPEESIPIPSEPPPESIPLPEESSSGLNPDSPPPAEEKTESVLPPILNKPSILAPSFVPVVDPSTVPFSSNFSSTGLFSGIFNNMSDQTQRVDNEINDNVPNMQIIKTALDRTTYLEKSLVPITPDDELKSVQEILTMVHNMDSNNSVILSGVLKGAEGSAPEPPRARPADPRLHPPPAARPQTVRRKLSLSEYYKRHGAWSRAAGGGAGAGAGDAGAGAGAWSSSSSGAGSLSPLRLDAPNPADDLEQRLHRAFAQDKPPKGVFDAAPTCAERVREKLSSRLRREFGLALPDDDDRARAHAALPESSSGTTERTER